MSNNVDVNAEGFDDLMDYGLSQNDTDDNSLNNNDTNLDDGTDSNTDSNPTNNDDGTNTELDDSNVDFISTFLNDYGVKDGKISYENEDGTIEEVDFNSLNPSEKVNILKELTTPNLSKDEISVVNYLRSNNATIQDVISYYSQKAVDDYVKANGPVEKNYAIDEYSNDELYIADLKAKFSDMTDEEVQADLENAKSNEELFKKKVDTIRTQYKEQEEIEKSQKEEAEAQKMEAFKSELENQLVDFNEISMDYKDNKADQLQIEDSEKEEIYRYILSQDEDGATQFFKDLNDPKNLIELAWFKLYGKDAISDISNYWKSQLKNTRKQDTKPQTVVVPKNRDQRKDNFSHLRNSVETEYGEDLL